MENNNNKDKNKGLFKLILLVLLIVFGVIGYFVYEGFFTGSTNTVDSSTNTYVVNTRLGKDSDIINKENISFSTNINSQSLKQDFSYFEVISPSQQVGRANPFLP